VPHPDIQQYLVNVPAHTEPGQKAEAGASFQASIEPHLLARACKDVRGAGGDIPVLLTVGELER